VGTTCIAAPVLNKSDRIQGSIRLCGPQSRISKTRRTGFDDVIQRAANVTQVNLDYV